MILSHSTKVSYSYSFRLLGWYEWLTLYSLNCLFINKGILKNITCNHSDQQKDLVERIKCLATPKVTLAASVFADKWLFVDSNYPLACWAS